MLQQNDFDAIDVVVLGGGLAGMAVGIRMVRAGLRVLCIEGQATDTAPVGESLDWSAPELLSGLGLPMQTLIDEGFGTWKRHVTMRLEDGSMAHYVPGEWLGQPPFNIELRTLHVDRTRLNAAVRKIAIGAGVRFLQDQVTEVEARGRTVLSVTMASGRRVAAPWFIDASGGAARLLPRTFNLRTTDYGPAKVAIWTYLPTPESVEGTTLHTRGDCPAYMDWVWEIPVQSDKLSIGFVAAGETIKSLRASGKSVESILRMQLERLPRLQALMRRAPEMSASVTAFRCRVHKHIFGPNWLVIGEAAAMVDPMTSNGVTSALRHANEAAGLMVKYRGRKRLPWLAAAMYSRRVQDMARFFNCGIEKVIYDGPIRNQIGIKTAGDVYTIPAWSLNNVYARVKSHGVLTSMLFCVVLGAFRAAASTLHAFCKSQESMCETSG